MKARIVKAYHDVKYKLRPPRVAYDAALSAAREASTADLEAVVTLDADQQRYLSHVNLLADPLTDDIECEGHEHG